MPLAPQIFKIDTERNLIYVVGHVPGNAGGFVRVVDAVKGPQFPSPPPFPTQYGKVAASIMHAPTQAEDPLAAADVDV